MQIDRGTSLTGYLSRTHLRLVLFAHTVGLNGFMPDAHEGTMMTHMFSGAAWGGGKSHGAPHPPRSEWLCVCLCVCVFVHGRTAFHASCSNCSHSRRTSWDVARRNKSGNATHVACQLHPRIERSLPSDCVGADFNEACGLKNRREKFHQRSL